MWASMIRQDMNHLGKLLSRLTRWLKSKKRFDSSSKILCCSLSKKKLLWDLPDSMWFVGEIWVIKGFVAFSGIGIMQSSGTKDAPAIHSYKRLAKQNCTVSARCLGKHKMTTQPFYRSEIQPFLCLFSFQVSLSMFSLPLRRLQLWVNAPVSMCYRRAVCSKTESGILAVKRAGRDQGEELV